MNHKGVLLVAASAAFVATQAIFVKLAYAAGVNVLTALTLRFTFSSLIFLGILYFSGQSMKVSQGFQKLLVFLILIHIVLDALVFETYSLMPASLAVMFLYAYPAFTGILAYLLLHEKLGAAKIGALVLSGVGLVLLLWGSWDNVSFAGVFMALGAALSYAVYLVYLPGLLSSVHKMTFCAWLFLVSAAVYFAIGVITGGLDFSFAPAGWFYLLATSIISSVTATVCLFYGLPLVGPTQSAIILTLEPPITVILGYLVFHEVLSGSQLTGAVLILLAVVLPPIVQKIGERNTTQIKNTLLR